MFDTAVLAGRSAKLWRLSDEHEQMGGQHDFIANARRIADESDEMVRLNLQHVAAVAAENGESELELAWTSINFLVSQIHDVPIEGVFQGLLLPMQGLPPDSQ